MTFQVQKFQKAVQKSINANIESELKLKAQKAHEGKPFHILDKVGGATTPTQCCGVGAGTFWPVQLGDRLQLHYFLFVQVTGITKMFKFYDPYLYF